MCFKVVSIVGNDFEVKGSYHFHSEGLQLRRWKPRILKKTTGSMDLDLPTFQSHGAGSFCQVVKNPIIRPDPTKWLEITTWVVQNFTKKMFGPVEVGGFVTLVWPAMLGTPLMLP